MTARPPYRRRLSWTAALTAGLLAAGAIASAGGGPAGAAAQPEAQSVGRFLDGSVGGNPLQRIADLKDARAQSPGVLSAQNPLDAKLLGALDAPLGNALKLPGGGVFHFGAVNQLAVAKPSGYSYGASGAVSNSGGISLGGNDGAYPADATIDLSSAALGSVPVPGLPGGTDSTAAALGGVQAQIGAVSALAKTESGGRFTTPRYKIAGLTLRIGSPALGALLQQLAAGSKTLSGLLGQLASAAGSQLPNDCALTSGTVPGTIRLDGGAVVVEPANATITVDLEKLLAQLGANLNALPPNTDLLGYLLNNLGTILSRGLEHVINGVTGPLEQLGNKCLPALGPLAGPLGSLLAQLQSQQPLLESAINRIADELANAGAPGLAALTDGLGRVLSIGVNVQQGAFPLGSEPSPKYRFTSRLAATPDQATPVVPGQGVVRALEIDAAAGQVDLALGNAAAGPSQARAPVASSSSPPRPVTPQPARAIPTGVPAGMGAPNGGTPVLPIVLLALAVACVAGGAVAAVRYRGR